MATTSKERSPALKLTAQERLAVIVDAAMHEFASGGFDGTATAAIAQRAGMSQPYLFALFGTKQNLFIAAVKLGFARMRALVVRAAGQDGEGDDALNSIRTALLSLRRERMLLLLQLHVFAACEDLDVRAVTRAEFEETRRALASACGAPDRLVRYVLAAAMNLPEAWS